MMHTGEKRILPRVKLLVCSPCQNSCQFCANTEIRSMYPGFQLTMEQLERFLQLTEESGYHIGNLRIVGPGEPLLWKHINEGLRSIRNSGVVDTIFITTNGLNFKVLTDESWSYINDMRLSFYENFSDFELLKSLQKRFPGIIKLDDKTEFIELMNNKDDPAPIPCKCRCDGPTSFGDIILYYCGPVVFSAAKVIGTDFLDYGDLYTKLDVGYMDGFKDNRIGNLELCKYCFGNPAAKYRQHLHSSD